MLIDGGSHLFAYAVTRDLGFAPNPFHGVCTLATCKPRVRKSAQVGDWVMGVGGKTLGHIYRKCIFLMKVTEISDFQSYWQNPEFRLKRPVRNGSNVQMLGDNIYHKDQNGSWVQEDSHHSNDDGTYNLTNLERDTGETDAVLISRFFFYFGQAAISVDLESIGYQKVRDYIKRELVQGAASEVLVRDICERYKSDVNFLMGDPCQFDSAYKRVDQKTGKLS